jgi:ketosteroid isomerase-like protein
MSDENVELAATELIRKWVDAWNRGDLDTFTSVFGDDALVITDPSWMEAGPFEGRAAIRQWYAGLREAWGEHDVTVITELFEVGDSVLVRANWEVQGRSSGIETVLDVTCVCRIEHGRIVRQQWYFDYKRALEAVGLTE